MSDALSEQLPTPRIVDREAYLAEVDALPVREKVHMRESDAIAAARRQDSPNGWPQRWEGKQRVRTEGRPAAQWPRLQAGHSDDLGNGGG